MANPLFHHGRITLGVERETCLCVGHEILGVVRNGQAPALAAAALTLRLREFL